MYICICLYTYKYAYVCTCIWKKKSIRNGEDTPPVITKWNVYSFDSVFIHGVPVSNHSVSRSQVRVSPPGHESLDTEDQRMECAHGVGWGVRSPEVDPSGGGGGWRVQGGYINKGLREENKPLQNTGSFLPGIHDDILEGGDLSRPGSEIYSTSSDQWAQWTSAGDTLWYPSDPQRSQGRGVP